MDKLQRPVYLVLAILLALSVLLNLWQAGQSRTIQEEIPPKYLQLIEAQQAVISELEFFMGYIAIGDSDIESAYESDTGRSTLDYLDPLEKVDKLKKELEF